MNPKEMVDPPTLSVTRPPLMESSKTQSPCAWRATRIALPGIWIPLSNATPPGGTETVRMRAVQAPCSQSAYFHSTTTPNGKGPDPTANCEGPLNGVQSKTGPKRIVITA